MKCSDRTEERGLKSTVNKCRLIEMLKKVKPKKIMSFQIFFKKGSSYHWNDGTGDIWKLDATLVKDSDEKLAVFSSVLMLYIVSFHHFLLQNQNHLQYEKHTLNYHGNSDRGVKLLND